MYSKNIAFIIQARMQSNRLPGKVMLPLPLNGEKPLLGWITDELRSSTIRKDIIVATSQNQGDDVIASFCRSNDILCYRGSEQDVLSRFQEIAKRRNYDIVLRFTADNPFVDIGTIEETITYHIEHNVDLTYTSGMPLGLDVEVINGKALLNSGKHNLSGMDKEHATRFIRNEEQYKKGVFKPNIKKELQDLRVTVDYPSDFILASAICSLAATTAAKQGLPLIEEVFEQYPWLFKANKDNIQKKSFKSVNDEIKAAKKILNTLDLNRAANVLSN